MRLLQFKYCQVSHIPVLCYPDNRRAFYPKVMCSPAYNCPHTCACSTAETMACAGSTLSLQSPVNAARRPSSMAANALSPQAHSLHVCASGRCVPQCFPTEAVQIRLDMDGDVFHRECLTVSSLYSYMPLIAAKKPRWLTTTTVLPCAKSWSSL